MNTEIWKVVLVSSALSLAGTLGMAYAGRMLIGPTGQQIGGIVGGLVGSYFGTKWAMGK